MTIDINKSQRKAAKVVGMVYLFGFVAVFNEFYVRDKLIVFGDATQTALNILAHERLFRLGTAIDLIEMSSIVVLATALYVILKEINQGLALVATLWRLMEAVICVVMTLGSFDVLRILTTATYLRVFPTDQVQALARLYAGAHGDAYNVAEIFLGLGSTVFGWLWFKSGYIPRGLAAFGLFGSALLPICTIAFIIFPQFRDFVGLFCYLPIGAFELTMGFWLLLRGLKPITISHD